MKQLHVIILACLFAAPVFLWGQGALTPPDGGPAPSMKTLEQIEPRIDLQNAPASAVSTTNSTYHYVINAPGSYYLSANIGVTKPSGIYIIAEGVTLDLKGFGISRATGSGGDGIAIGPAAHRTTVRNGSLKGFGHGIQSYTLGGATARGCAYRDLTVSNCTAIGIYAGRGATLDSCRVLDGTGSYGFFVDQGAVLTNCTAANNNVANGVIQVLGGNVLTNCSVTGSTATYGILAGPGSSLSNCVVRGNTVSYGFYTDVGATLTNCSAVANSSAAANSAGFYAGLGAVLSNCVAYGQTSTAATLTGSTGTGFHLSGGNTLQNSAARFNLGDGIQASTRCLVAGNVSTGNGVNAGIGSGIHVTSTDNRIEGNNVTVNDRGIQVAAAGNVIVRNTASGNGINWDIASGNVIFVTNSVISGAFSGNSGGTAQTATDPNANFTY